MKIQSKKRHRINQMLFRMAKLILQPGDLIVLQTDLDLSHVQVVALEKAANRKFKPYRVIVLTHGLKIGVIRKKT